MRRLPGGIIVRTQIGNKIVLDEHPAPTDLGSRDLSGPSFFGEGDGVNLQEVRGFSECECLHVFAVLQRR